MRATHSEQALRRVLAWLRWSGHELTPRLEQAALQALSDAVAAEESELVEAALRRLRDNAMLTSDLSSRSMLISPPYPPLRRSSIGYGRY
ncbi:hypothetical protein [Halopseudomonas pertucinogena]|uniref:Uncharacterized protein n=1 Tax=Halopseudomonas pertucinogena TaxID=86175 RepID=A0ABQ2CII8_9GAMM|nr:hypothetical protein [Halopseudomonas pertucinogena]GGI89639.1 hypothetical protein GCM10009083_02540 [Halopseudomonas pertucinogena]